MTIAGAAPVRSSFRSPCLPEGKRGRKGGGRRRGFACAGVNSCLHVGGDGAGGVLAMKKKKDEPPGTLAPARGEGKRKKEEKGRGGEDEGREVTNPDNPARTLLVSFLSGKGGEERRGKKKGAAIGRLNSPPPPTFLTIREGKKRGGKKEAQTRLRVLLLRPLM